MKTKRMLVSGLTLVAVLFTGVVIGKQTNNMIDGLKALQKARYELQQAEGDKGGHKARAIILIDEAIAEVQAGIEYAKRH